MLLPVLAKARQNAQRMKCVNNLKQWGLITVFYAEDEDDYFFPAAGVRNYYVPDTTATWQHYYGHLRVSYLPGVLEQKHWLYGKNINGCPAHSDGVYNTSGTMRDRYWSYGTNSHVAHIQVGKTDQFVSLKMRMVKKISSTFWITDLSNLVSRYSYTFSMLDERGGFLHENQMNVLYTDGHVENKRKVEIKEADYVVE